jgi:hypothetical protein
MKKKRSAVIQWLPVARTVLFLGLLLPSTVEKALAGPPPGAIPTGKSAAIMAENALPGTSSWRITYPAAHHEIEGFASATSVDHGHSINLFVNTAAPRYSITIYRMGWYGGTGGRLMRTIANRPNKTRQPKCTAKPQSSVTCPWHVSYTLAVPVAWLSGVYLAKLTVIPSSSAPKGTPSPESYIIFTVRDDQSTSAYLFQSSVNTYQAYNQWGGQSLYHYTDGKKTIPRGYSVSFDRPYYRGWGAGDFFFWEYPMMRWMEKNGYDVSYVTDLDVDASAGLLPRHKAFVDVGHDEYWSRNMYDHVQNARDHGVSLGFFGGNDVFDQIRLLPSSNGPRRVIVCYKDAPLDPLYKHQNSQVTTGWRNPPLNRPEQMLMGEMSESWFNTAFPLKVVNTSNRLFAGTGLHAGSSIPGVVGYEYDRVFPNFPKPKGLVILAASPVVTFEGKHSVSNATFYVAQSGASVFDAGSIEWAWGVDDDTINAGLNAWSIHHAASPALQRLNANILAAFLKPRPQA